MESQEGFLRFIPRRIKEIPQTLAKRLQDIKVFNNQHPAPEKPIDIPASEIIKQAGFFLTEDTAITLAYYHEPAMSQIPNPVFDENGPPPPLFGWTPFDEPLENPDEVSTNPPISRRVVAICDPQTSIMAKLELITKENKFSVQSLDIVVYDPNRQSLVCFTFGRWATGVVRSAAQSAILTDFIKHGNPGDENSNYWKQHPQYIWMNAKPFRPPFAVTQSDFKLVNEFFEKAQVDTALTAEYVDLLKKSPEGNKLQPKIDKNYDVSIANELIKDISTYPNLSIPVLTNR